MILRPYKLKISVNSITSSGLEFCKPILHRVGEELSIEIEVHEEKLQKKKLKAYKSEFDDTRNRIDGCILVHKDDGRLLMTDRNGIYDSFIREMYNVTSNFDPKILSKFSIFLDFFNFFDIFLNFFGYFFDFFRRKPTDNDPHI